jgi:hypothetical protein
LGSNFRHLFENIRSVDPEEARLFNLFRYKTAGIGLICGVWVICECGTAAPIKGNELAESVSLDCPEILRVLSLLLMGCRIYVKKEKAHVSLDFYFILFLLSHLRELHLGS